jgi:PAS domain S-box-containing protein
MLEQIQRNYTQRVTLATLARTLRRQSSYLGRLFREEIGVTVHEYVTRARMVHGAVQVRSGVKIEAVALGLGYQSKKNFYRQFRRRFGTTPEMYRHEWHEATVSDPVAVESSRNARISQGRTSHSSRFISGAANMAAGQTRDRSRVTLLAQKMMMRTLVGPRIAMLVTDDTGCYVGANSTAVAMTGYSVDKLRGMRVEVLFPYMSGSETRCRLQILLSASSSLRTNTVLRTKSAGPVRVHLTSAENLLEDRQRRSAVF